MLNQIIEIPFFFSTYIQKRIKVSLKSNTNTRGSISISHTGVSFGGNGSPYGAQGRVCTKAAG